MSGNTTMDATIPCSAGPRDIDRFGSPSAGSVAAIVGRGEAGVA